MMAGARKNGVFGLLPLPLNCFGRIALSLAFVLLTLSATVPGRALAAVSPAR